MKKYILNAAGQPEHVASLETWAVWFEANFDKRSIGKTEVDGQEVSTVFLGTDHAWGGGPPLLFETMIFGGKWDNWQWRWHTRDEAEQAHARIVAALQEGRAPEDAEEPDAGLQTYGGNNP